MSLSNEFQGRQTNYFDSYGTRIYYLCNCLSATSIHFDTALPPTMNGSSYFSSAWLPLWSGNQTAWSSGVSSVNDGISSRCHIDLPAKFDGIQKQQHSTGHHSESREIDYCNNGCGHKYSEPPPQSSCGRHSDTQQVGAAKSMNTNRVTSGQGHDGIVKSTFLPDTDIVRSPQKTDPHDLPSFPFHIPHPEELYKLFLLPTPQRPSTSECPQDVCGFSAVDSLLKRQDQRETLKEELFNSIRLLASQAKDTRNGT